MSICRDNLQAPLFSVIVPTFDRPEFLPRAIASVLAQTITDFEVLIVDDAGSIAPVVVNDSRVRVLRRDTNGGPAATLNTGVAAARGRYLAYLDDDDLWVPHRLELALAGLARAPLTVCWSRYLDEAPSPKFNLEGDVSDVIFDHVTPHRNATALDHEVFLPFDESFLGGEDVEWWLRMSSRCDFSTVPAFGALLTRHEGVRGIHGDAARISGGRRLLNENRDWFSRHPRAAALRWQRVGLTAARSGQTGAARYAFARSLRARPGVRPALHLARTFLSSRRP